MGRTESDNPPNTIVLPQTDADRKRLDDLAKERGVIDAGTTRVSEQPLYPPDYSDEEEIGSTSS